MQSVTALSSKLNKPQYAQTLPIFLKITQNKGNHEPVSNLYWQFMHNKTQFWLKIYYLLIKI